MKKVLSLLLVFLFVFCLAACSNDAQDSTTGTTINKVDTPSDKDQSSSDENIDNSTDDTADNTDDSNNIVEEEKENSRDDKYNDYDNYDDPDAMYRDDLLWGEDEYENNFDNDMLLEENDITKLAEAVNSFCTSQHTCQYDCSLRADVISSTEVTIYHTVATQVPDDDVLVLDTIIQQLKEDLATYIYDYAIFYQGVTFNVISE